MRIISAYFLVALLGMMAFNSPLYAESPKNDTGKGTEIIVESEDAVMVNGSVVEGPGAIPEKHRRRSLSSRGGSIINTATRYMGTPYRWAGTSPSGFDCSGFVMTVYSMNGLSIRRMADEQYYGGNKLRKEELMPGDLVFFTTYGPGVTHVGIYMGEEKFIHASSRHGVTISSLNDPYYKARFLGGCRY
jgi:cell wall-associated NlpC family hydrolase